MAEWTYEKVSKRQDGRVFTVEVAFYRDGKFDHIESFGTTTDQPADWPAEGVKRHIRDLEGVEGLMEKISTGEIVLPADPVVDSEAVAWNADYALASRVKHLVDLGVIEKDDAKYAELIARLRANYKPEFVGLT